MKETKFRAWDKKSKKWVEDDVVLLPNGKINIVNLDSEVNEEDVEIVFFTGRKGKNGKEIYEGDIVEVVKKIDKNVVIGEIYFNYKKVGFDIKFDIKKYNLIILGDLVRKFSKNLWKNVKVIGNIYENPELLK